MGEFESNIKYAKAVGEDVSRPQFDRRTTSQRVTDEMNQMKAEIKWYRKWLEQIDIDGTVTGEDAEDMRRWARLALTQAPDKANVKTKLKNCGLEIDLAKADLRELVK